MVSTVDKVARHTTTVQQKAAGSSFFRKAGDEPFFGAKEPSSFFGGSIQPKLSVSHPDDPQEKEADAVAEKVMRMPEPVAPINDKREEEALHRKEDEKEELQTKPALPVLQRQEIKEEKLQPKCEECEKEDKKAHAKLFAEPGVRSTNLLHRKALSLHSSDVIQCSGRGPPAGSPSFEQTLSDSKGGGSVLPTGTRQSMENRFGSDFSDVRVHTGSTAENLSRSINAQAFTHGNDIYFNSGKFSPNTADGGNLLAHELTHTIQQGPSSKRNSIQPKLKDLEQPGHGRNAKQRLKNEVDTKKREREKNDDTEDKKLTPEEKQRNARRLKAIATPEINEPRRQIPKTQKEKQKAREKIQKPPPPGGKKGVKPSSKSVKKTPSSPQEHAAKSKQLVQKANAVKPADVPSEIKFPEVFKPEDSKGQLLPLNAKQFMAAAAALRDIQTIRFNGYKMQLEGSMHEAKSYAMESYVHSANALVTESEQNLHVVDHGIEERKEVLIEANKAHETTDNKQKKVEAELPAYSERINAEKGDVADTVTESRSLASENESNQPEDSDDRSSSEGIGSGLSDISSGATTIGNTYSSSESNIDFLKAQNVEAKTKNSESKNKLGVIGIKLTQSIDKAAYLHGVNNNANNSIQEHKNQPLEVRVNAHEMQNQGRAMIDRSIKLEEKVHLSLRKYRQNLKNVPPLYEPEKQNEPGASAKIHRKPLGDYAGRIDIFSETDLKVLQSEQQRSEAQIKADEANAAELKYIQEQLPGDFKQYSKWDKIGTGLKAKFSGFGRWFTNLSVSDVIGAAGHMLLAVINPVGGIKHGVMQLANGVVNLVHDIRTGNWWGILKSAADIASGIATIAGTITGFALLLEAAMALLCIFIFTAPFALTVMALAGEVMAFTGPIALWAGLIAAGLNFIAGIKSLVDMGNAESAEQLQAETNDFTQDVGGVASGLMNALVGKAGMKAAAAMPQTIAAAKNAAVAFRIASALSGRMSAFGMVAADTAAAVGRGILDFVTLKGIRRSISNWWKGGEAGAAEAAAGAGKLPEEQAGIPPEKGEPPTKPERTPPTENEPVPDPATTAKPGDFTAEEILDSEARVTRATEHPENINPIEDPVYDTEIDLENGDKYMRKRGTDSWCLVKNPKICGKSVPQNISKAADAAQAKPPKGTSEGDKWRYKRYKENGGEKSYKEWFKVSRGGRSGGPGHQEIQQRLTSQGYTTEKQFGDRFADAYKKGEIHQIGGLNKRGDPISRERDAIDDIIKSKDYKGEDIYFWDKNNPSAKPIKNPQKLPSWNGGPDE